MGHLVHAHEEDLLKPFLIEPQIHIIKHDHSPDGSLRGFQRYTRSRFCNVDSLCSLLVATEDADISDGALGDINLRHFE